MKDCARKDDLEERFIDLAVRIIDVVEALPVTRAGNHVATHLLRAGTSPAPNYANAQGVEDAEETNDASEEAVEKEEAARQPLLAPNATHGSAHA